MKRKYLPVKDIYPSVFLFFENVKLAIYYCNFVYVSPEKENCFIELFIVADILREEDKLFMFISKRFTISMSFKGEV